MPERWANIARGLGSIAAGLRAEEERKRQRELEEEQRQQNRELLEMRRKEAQVRQRLAELDIRARQGDLEAQRFAAQVRSEFGEELGLAAAGPQAPARPAMPAWPGRAPEPWAGLRERMLRAQAPARGPVDLQRLAQLSGLAGLAGLPTPDLTTMRLAGGESLQDIEYPQVEVPGPLQSTFGRTMRTSQLPFVGPTLEVTAPERALESRVGMAQRMAEAQGVGDFWSLDAQTQARLLALVDPQASRAMLELDLFPLEKARAVQQIELAERAMRLDEWYRKAQIQVDQGRNAIMRMQGAGGGAGGREITGGYLEQLRGIQRFAGEQLSDIREMKRPKKVAVVRGDLVTDREDETLPKGMARWRGNLVPYGQQRNRDFYVSVAEWDLLSSEEQAYYDKAEANAIGLLERIGPVELMGIGLGLPLGMGAEEGGGAPRPKGAARPSARRELGTEGEIEIAWEALPPERALMVRALVAQGVPLLRINQDYQQAFGEPLPVRQKSFLSGLGFTPKSRVSF